MTIKIEFICFNLKKSCRFIACSFKTDSVKVKFLKKITKCRLIQNFNKVLYLMMVQT